VARQPWDSASSCGIHRGVSCRPMALHEHCKAVRWCVRPLWNGFGSRDRQRQEVGGRSLVRVDIVPNATHACLERVSLSSTMPLRRRHESRRAVGMRRFLDRGPSWFVT
jgi:hypothetical protein